MYKFTIDINPNTHDEFVKKHPLCNLLQSSNWAQIKDNWGHKYIGVYEGEELPEDYICPLCKHGAQDFEPIK